MCGNHNSKKREPKTGEWVGSSAGRTLEFESGVRGERGGGLIAIEGSTKLDGVNAGRIRVSYEYDITKGGPSMTHCIHGSSRCNLSGGECHLLFVVCPPFCW